MNAAFRRLAGGVLMGFSLLSAGGYHDAVIERKPVVDLRGKLAGDYNWPPRDTAKIHVVYVHHTGINGGTWRSVAEFHASVRKWHAIGYSDGLNYLGQRYRLNDHDVRTNHTAGHNTEGLGLACMGNYSTKMPTREMVVGIIDYVHEMDSIYGIDKVLGHRDVVRTECPGDSLYMVVKGIWP